MAFSISPTESLTKNPTTERPDLKLRNDVVRVVYFKPRASLTSLTYASPKENGAEMWGFVQIAEHWMTGNALLQGPPQPREYRSAQLRCTCQARQVPKMFPVDSLQRNTIV
jgi:hypothetical protein